RYMTASLEPSRRAVGRARYCAFRLLEPAKSKDIERRFEQLTRGCFSRVGFSPESHVILRKYAAGRDSVWRALGCLNDTEPIPYEIKRIEGTLHWFEIKPILGLRIYYREPRNGAERLPVLV